MTFPDPIWWLKTETASTDSAFGLGPTPLPLVVMDPFVLWFPAVVATVLVAGAGLAAWVFRLKASRDSTARKHSSNQPGDERTAYEELFTSILNGVAVHEVIWSEDGEPEDFRFVQVNPAFESHTGLRGDSVLGKTLREVFPNLESHWTDTYRGVIRTGHPANLENYSGQLEKYFEVTAIRSHRNHLITIFSDITDRRNAEQERLAAVGEAEEANRARGDFLAMMSHELRTPLNGILGFAELLEHTSLEKEQKEFLQVITSSGNHLLRIVNDILDFSSIEEKGIQLEPVAVGLRGMLEEVAKTTEPAILAKGLELKLTIDPELPFAIQLDATRFRQILFNLLGNAVKFTVQGRIELAAGRSNDTSPPMLQIAVIDSGPGIPTDLRETLFEPFAQSSIQSQHPHSGTGLGLAISRRLARAMGGDLTVSS